MSLRGGDLPSEVVTEVGEAAAREHGLPASLLDGYLATLVEVAVHDRRLTRDEVAHCRDLGAEAAQGGVALPALVDLYMSASRRLWPRLPQLVGDARGRPVGSSGLVAVGEAVWQGADTALAALAAGHEEAQREVVRREEAFRREFVDDLLTGRSDVGYLVERAGRLGMSLTGSHTVTVAATDRPTDSGMHLTKWLEDEARLRSGNRAVLVVAKDGRLVTVLSSGPAQAGREADGQALAEAAGSAVARLTRRPGWRVGVGRSHPGPRGVLRSYGEAVDALEVAERLDLPERVVHARDMLVYRVLLRDEEAISDLVGTVLGPLTEARGGPEALVRTVEAYFADGRNAASAARRLHLSVRAVTYRLQRVRELSGYDPVDPADQLALMVAVTGARLLDWPTTPLGRPEAGTVKLPGHGKVRGR
ncbi:PucR family transcriptional regulator [Blastococcus sp. VKM Ac-2987]|uniref:PucR family transcriptional regulator n=1 Tax=Blastococcus sp. VKM Ac-2987 TaxID=3004141 RepID=UPI0022AB8702|nr:helix-turn-helix domain-containing protein [Blastococcus sp. VKM Ac-2987]MCZ2857114.1 helix-turn-helix domain-containing protein [Blastococcus sp. VKM Ac-2987]